ncbi:MAG: hypothetical protein E3J72_13605 [Planctomycetota bacterium]|nr:MAG: hypothetical protein E3J72_13605 [Planctomycetota bacterium]
MDEQEGPKKTISRREHLDHVVRFCLGIWAVFAIAAAFILAKFLDEPVDFFGAFIGWLFIFTIVAIIFGILTGLVVNRLLLVAYTKPDHKEVPVSWVARIGRAGRKPITILVLVLLLGSLVVSLMTPITTAHPPEYEKAAIATMRTLSSTQEQYRSRFGSYASLKNLSEQQFIDPVLGSGEMAKYRIKVVVKSQNEWYATAVSIKPGKYRLSSFYIDQTGVIRFTTDGSPPTSTSPTVD